MRFCHLHGWCEGALWDAGQFLLPLWRSPASRQYLLTEPSCPVPQVTPQLVIKCLLLNQTVHSQTSPALFKQFFIDCDFYSFKVRAGFSNSFIGHLWVNYLRVNTGHLVAARATWTYPLGSEGSRVPQQMAPWLKGFYWTCGGAKCTMVLSWDW